MDIPNSSPKSNLTVTSEIGSWLSEPGALSGAEVFYYGDGYLGVKAGRIGFVDGYAATLNADTLKACIVPNNIGDVAYVIALSDRRSVTFRVVAYNKTGTDKWDHDPIVIDKGVVLAKLIIDHPITGKSSIKIFNYWQLKGENTFISVKPLITPDGINKDFVIPCFANSKNAISVYLDGLVQSEGVDYVVNTLRTPDGELRTNITFVGEAPGDGSEIDIKAYAGKIILN